MREAKKNRPQLAILAPHPVQYHAPLFREIAATGKVDLLVYYCDTLGLQPRFEPYVNAVIEWDLPLLAGYNYYFLRNFSKAQFRVPFFSRVNPGIIWQLLRHPVDVVLIQGYLDLTYWLAVLVAKLMGARIIFRSEATLQPGEQGQGGLLKYPLRVMLGLADHTLYSCTGNHAYFLNYGAQPEKMSLIPCSVDNVYFEQQHQKIVAQSGTPKGQLGLKEDVCYVMSTAIMEPRKRLKDIVRAIAICQRQGFKVGLILVGNGPQNQELTDLIEELGLSDTHLPGWQNSQGVSRYYAAVDIFVLASEHDPSPKALSEALVFGLPALCTSVIGTAPDLVREGENGFLYPVGDVAALAERLSRLLSDSKLRQEMGQRSREISQEWSISAAAGSVIRAVYQALGQSHEAETR